MFGAFCFLELGWGGECGCFLFLCSWVVSFGCDVDTIRGEGGLGEMLRAFPPTPSFKVYMGVPLCCGTVGLSCRRLLDAAKRWWKRLGD